MVSTDNKYQAGKNRKGQKVRPGFLMAAVFALAGFVIVMGTSLDLAMRPMPAAVPTPSQSDEQAGDPRQQFWPPQFLNNRPYGGEGGLVGRLVPDFFRRLRPPGLGASGA